MPGGEFLPPDPVIPAGNSIAKMTWLQ